jgi:hypothetical protein
MWAALVASIFAVRGYRRGAPDRGSRRAEPLVPGRAGASARLGALPRLLGVRRIDIPEYALTAKPSGEQITQAARGATRIFPALADEDQHVRSKGAGSRQDLDPGLWVRDPIKLLRQNLVRHRFASGVDLTTCFHCPLRCRQLRGLLFTPLS